MTRSPFHPNEIARDLTHKARQKGSCATDIDRTEECSCLPDEATLAEVWAGRARMAKARLDSRSIVSYKDETVRELGDDGAVHEWTERRYFIETDPAKILDDIDREALRKAGLE